MDSPQSALVSTAARVSTSAVNRIPYVLVVLAVALTFQGSRGLWEPDEGRYATAAIEMVDRGDWIIPSLHGLIFLDKPPAIYWSVMAGTKLLGQNEWGARLGHALAFAATAFILGAWSKRSGYGGSGHLAGAVYATTLLPVLAANVLTPDTLLTFCTTAVCFSYWRYRTASADVSRWLWALVGGLALSGGLLSKGPACLIFVAPVVVHVVWEGDWRKYARRPEVWIGGAIGVTIGAAWYMEVWREYPLSLGYFFDNQVAGRLWEDSYNRNFEWWKPLRIYGPVLLIGSMPWSLFHLKDVALGGRAALRRGAEFVTKDSLGRLLLLSVVLPLFILIAAQSRLELYVLPVFPYLAMLAAARWGRRASRRSRSLTIAGAAVLLIGLKTVGSSLMTERDTRRIAERLHQAQVPSAACIGAVEKRVHGLGFYGFERVTWHTLWPQEYPYFERARLLEEDLASLIEDCGSPLWLVSRPAVEQAVRTVTEAGGLSCAPVVAEGRLVILLCFLTEHRPSSALPAAQIEPWSGIDLAT